MTPLYVYQTYIAIKLHFNNPSYNFIDAKGAIRGASNKNLNNRRDKLFFEKLCKRLRKKDVIPFFVSLFVSNQQLWVGDIWQNMDECMVVYRKWLGKMQALSENINEDIYLLNEFVDNRNIVKEKLFEVKECDHPIILKFYLGDMINLETLIYLNKNFHFVSQWDDILLDPIWENTSLIMRKYASFLRAYDFSKINKLI